MFFSLFRRATCILKGNTTLSSSRRHSDRRLEFYDKFIFTALGFFWLAALLNPILFYFVNTASGEKELINLIATWFFSYRELQLVGFAAMLIFGISQRFIPVFLGFKGTSQKRANVIYGMLLSAIIVETVFYLLLRRSFSPLWGAGLQISFLLMLGAGALMIPQLGLFKRHSRRDRSVKFFRAAYLWLIIAFFLLVFLPLYNRLTGQAFSHAFFGAYRHALTVGFISMMILGVSAKIIPMWSGQGLQTMNPLYHAFFLLNIGNILRVVSQIAAEHVIWAFPVMGASGFVEVAALAFWGVDIWRTINARPSQLRTRHKEQAPLFIK